MARAAFGALISHWLRHPLQLAMLLLGLSLATALWSGVQAINAEARASYAEAAAVLGQNRLTRIEAAAGEPISQEVFVALRRAGWPVSPVLEGSLRLGEARLRLIGIEPLTLPAPARQVDLAAGEDLAGFLRPPGLIFTSAETAARIGAGAADLPPLRRADLPPGLALTDIGVAQRLLGQPGALSHLLLDPAVPAPDPARLPPGLVLIAPEPEGDLARLTDSFHLNLTAFGLLAFAVGLFIVHSAIGLAFEQRRGVFRTLRALGLPLRALTGLLLAELLGLALIAGLVGLALGYGIAAALLPDVAATLRGLYGAEVAGSLRLRPGWALAGLGMALAGALISAGQSLWRLWNLPILAPARPREWARATGRGLRRQAVAGVGLWGAAVALWALGSGLWAGLGVLAGLLLGAAFLLPVLLAALTAGLARGARGVLGQWFWADTRQQLPGLSLALMALLLALAANIGVGTMVASFRVTFTGWLDQRLVSELYITTRDPAEAQAVQGWLAPQVSAILPIWSVEATLAGQRGRIFGVADHATYRDHWPLLAASPGVWDRVAAGEGVLVNEQLARRARLGLGAALALPGGGALPVVGVYSDYGNPEAQAMLGDAALAARVPAAPRLRFALRLNPAQAPALAAALTERFALPPEAILDQAAVKAFSLRVFERTFAVTAALNALTLGVAGLALFASLTTLAGMRLPQLAPLWAMGLRLRHLATLEAVRALALAALVVLAAVPLGVALAWVLLAVVNVAAFGWRLPMQVFPVDWLKMAGLAGLAALAAAALPVLRLARSAPADLVKVFSNER